MDLSRIHQDLMMLAGELPHRGAQSHQERRAAEFLLSRFKEYTPDVEMDDFNAIDSPNYFFAACYTEFLIVSVLAIWWPSFAAGYGAMVFMLYLAELMGYQVLSRFMPQYPSQNVVARFLSPRPERLLVVFAHYDSGAATPLTDRAALRWWRPVHLLLLLCMVIVVATCLSGAFPLDSGEAHPFLLYLRWSAAGVLACAAALLFLAATQNEDIRGANENASGTAALLRVADALSKQPMEHCDVWVAALGCNESWMSGARHLIATQGFDRANTCFINLEAVGAGKLHYLKSEGFVNQFRADRRLAAAAEKHAEAHGITPGVFRALPTAAHPAHARGYAAMSVMGLDEDGLPVNWNSIEDRVTAVEESHIAAAADFTTAILQQLDADASAGGLRDHMS